MERAKALVSWDLRALNGLERNGGFGIERGEAVERTIFVKLCKVEVPTK